ncbi:energy transducer TonB [Mesoterricola silvestris]|uniref:TonB C-terminal domain-containing protein n=1 Tax=Mesoterricola silvestris TaxID=2927979 RepID=A0AA48GPS1_9BACT|nr:hypothetical protein [Mesoterricola silvestris]BDU71925.1 hypothetical protein METEAL_10990 [Mesoterricola silvestris]
MLPPALPPAETRPAPSLAQVHGDLKTARQAAEKSRRPVLGIFPEDETRFQAALSFLNTLEGARLRSESEVWLARPGDPSAQALLDKAEIRSLPAVVKLDSRARTVQDFLAGSDGAPLDKACRELMEREDAHGVPPLERIRAWSGGMDPAPFVAFGQARAQDLGAAALEPHRSWLVGLVKNPDSRLRAWAATRLVEANARMAPGDPDAWGAFLEFRLKEFYDTIRNRMTGRVSSPWGKLGAPGFIGPKAPFWPAIRALLRSPKAPALGASFYALMAPELRAEDREWVLGTFTAQGHRQAGEPWNNTAFWIGTDWLLAYGAPADWAAFASGLTDGAWKTALHDVEYQVRQVPAFWDASPAVQDLFCEGETADAFWKNPDGCLASWGVTRETLVELGIDQIRLLKGGAYPRYPEEAKRRGFTGIVHVRTLVDAKGKPLWARPLPGYALCFFAPFGVRYAANATFEAAKVGGVGRPAQFVFHFPFKRR